MAYAVKLLEFNTRTGKYVDAIKSVTLGVHPPNNFVVNAVEVIFTLDKTQATTLSTFRCRQKVAEQALWEKKGGKGTLWSKTMSTGGEPDDPDEGLQKFVLPIIAFHDAPGFMAVLSNSTFSRPREQGNQ